MKKTLSILTFAMFLLNVLLLKAQETDDPYLWLEDIESVQSLEWVKAQNSVSEKTFKETPLFKSLSEKFLNVYNDEEKIAIPNLVGKYVYNFWQDAQNERGVWRRMLKEDYVASKTNWEIVLDLDELSKNENKKWVFGGAIWFEPDNNLCLLSLSDGGTDKSEFREFDAVKKEFVKDGFFIPASKGQATWIDINTLLIATDFGAGSSTLSGYPRIVKKWKRGTTIADAKTILEADSTIVALWPFSFYSNSKQHVGLIKAITFYESEIYYIQENEPKKLSNPVDAEIHGFYNMELMLALQSDWEVDDKTYPSGALVSIDMDDDLKGKMNVKLIYIPDDKSSIVSMSTSKDFIIVNIMENVQNKLIKYRLIDDKWVGEEITELPDVGGINLISSDNTTNDYFFRFSNFITPSTLYYAQNEKIQKSTQLKSYFNTSNLIVEQNWATSKDGTKIPYFIVHKKDLKLDGKNPLLIDAYGGFNISRQPNYSVTVGLGWLEQGGTYVLANIRGGGEFGPSWHQAAVKEKRQNAYDDLFAVSEDLITRKITSPEHLGLFGWSNGGLLTGVAFTQRPDLYKAVIVGAPLLDMKRYNKLLAGASWMGEYGNPDKPEDWAYLKKYSPYHNLFKNKNYPKVFFITSIKDDRVHPGHARKMAAKMADMGHPFFYHETIEGGHGAASTNKQQAEMQAMIYTYLNMMLN
ncbi:prolyl oligopeptidase family serine peptidase [uncultured Draconibacterium sp.]|uniref:prolyl oligopeptidase family serine peptidase n=1 Tax=uncultured Draconibacterium sp. TaxID=1573823 RepID=UPI0025FF3257|nr:prolyl oligopeptidase family serine peptidase [uncultured Draconibacterium sp.]